MASACGSSRPKAERTGSPTSTVHPFGEFIEVEDGAALLLATVADNGQTVVIDAAGRPWPECIAHDALLSATIKSGTAVWDANQGVTSSRRSEAWLLAHKCRYRSGTGPEYDCTGGGRKPGYLTDAFKVESDARRNQRQIVRRQRARSEWGPALPAKASSRECLEGRDFPPHGPGPPDASTAKG
jgi:hypothetical protein